MTGRGTPQLITPGAIDPGTPTTTIGDGRSRLLVDGARRAIDVIGAVVLFVLALPIVVVGALGAAVALRSWPLFAQQRIGRDQQPFTVWKIKTLPDDTPTYASKYELPASIPRFTQLLRDLHVDELPQLAQVVLGRMSLVGPRPEMAVLHDAMSPATAALRTTVRPGCTGLWQISPDCRGLIAEAPEYDVFYVQHHTLRLDLWILLRTGVELVRRHKCTTLDNVPAWTIRPLRPATRDAAVTASSATD